MHVSLQQDSTRPRSLIYSDDSASALARVKLRGRVVGVGVEAFLKSYTDRLGLDVRLDENAGATMTFDVSGKPELIDMLLTVCWLGPADAMVDDVEADFLNLNTTDLLEREATV